MRTRKGVAKTSMLIVFRLPYIQLELLSLLAIITAYKAQMAYKQKLEQKIGEALGLEMAAQKAVEELSLKGLLDQDGLKGKLEGMRKEAGNHQIQLEELVQKLSQSEELDSENIQEVAKETTQKASEIMKTYLGEEPDSSEAIEFLCLAEGGEVTHYEVLSAMTKGIKNRQFATKVKSILQEEKKHLQMCTRLAKQNATITNS
jgi:rubrerythrin